MYIGYQIVIQAELGSRIHMVLQKCSQYRAWHTGRADCIVETPTGVYIFEFKLDGTADDALCQIEEKGYARPYEADSRPVHRVGVSFSSRTGTIDDWREA